MNDRRSDRLSFGVYRSADDEKTVHLSSGTFRPPRAISVLYSGRRLEDTTGAHGSISLKVMDSCCSLGGIVPKQPLLSELTLAKQLD